MATDAMKLRDHVGPRAARKIREAVRRAPRSSEPTEVRLASVGDDDEVIVVVVVGQRALVSRSHAVGRSVNLREMRLRLAGAEAAVEEIAASGHARPPPSMTAAEASLLDEAGLIEDPSDAVTGLERSRIELEILLRDSLSLEEAASALGVGPSRLRQRLGAAERTLFGVKEGREWRIPRFQFATKRKLVRGIDQVLPHVRPDAHPLAVKGWLTSPHQDLAVGEDEVPVSPLAWLGAGGSVAVVADLAREI